MTMEYRPQCAPRGPRDAKVLVVGEAPGEKEVDQGIPFVGYSGQELERMLSEAGINPDSCRYTNVIQMRPPGNDFEKAFLYSSKKKATEAGGVYHRGLYVNPVVLEGLAALEREINSTAPNIIVPVGNPALWATTGNWGITKWRGSEIETAIGGVTRKVLPTYHPAAILRKWDWRPIAVQDLRKVAREKDSPDVYHHPYNFILRPDADTVLRCISELRKRAEAEPLALAVDIETRNRQIACIGLAWSDFDAICIPIQCLEDDRGYFSPEEEIEIIYALQQLLTMEHCHVIGQNFAYDNQYFARNYGFTCNLTDDTMLMQHVSFPGLPKGLDFISSMYREHHTYWKDEGKNWNPKTANEEQLWNYNCIDAVATYECQRALANVLHSFNLTEIYRERMRIQHVAFKMMLRGTRSNMDAKLQLASELNVGLAQIREWWQDVTGFDVFGKPKRGGEAPGVSSKKFMTFCYEYLKLPKKFSGTKGKRSLTANKEACTEWEESCEPVFRPLLAVIRHYRSMTVFKSTFADQELDHDDRWRCSNNVAGTDTFRWSTSEDAFGYGTNLQNIPKGDER